MAQARRSLLAELAVRFVDQRETLATAGLGLVLAGSQTARDALGAFLAERGAALPAALAYRTEVVETAHEGRPDIVGTVGHYRHLILEGKFWAALTDAQPVAYLRSLERDGCLLLVAPERRIGTVGAELVRRCERAELALKDAASLMRGGLATVDDRRLGVVSWRAVLGRLHAALSDSGQLGAAADVEQLMGLSELEDAEAFLPVTPADLSTPTPQRVLQFMELADALAEKGKNVGLLRLQGFRPAGTLGRYTRYSAAGPVQLAIFVDLRRWAYQRMTPLWVEAAVERGPALADLEQSIPPRVFYDGTSGRPVIPLHIKLHVEHEELLDDLLAQLHELNRTLQQCRPSLVLK